MKNIKVLFALLLALGMLVTSCEEDENDPAKPEVTITELGHGDIHSNDNKATIGKSLHVLADIVAEAKIDYVTVTIHPEGDDHADKKDDHEDEWELEETFSGDGITGLKNLEFHKDLAIDESAEAGKYHFHITVVDMEGNSASAEDEVELAEQATNVAVENFSINADEHDVSVATGSFAISFEATAQTGTLASYSIEVHNHPESGNEEDEFKIVDETFTDDFAGETTATVSKTITVSADAPLGEYHVEIIIIDSEGDERVLEGHIDLVE